MKQILIATIIVFVTLAFISSQDGAEAQTSQNAIVFSCTQSPDGICYAAANGTGPCYTSAGMGIGECKLSETIKPKTNSTICRSETQSCPYVTTAKIMKHVVSQYPEMYTYQYSDTQRQLEGYCIGTDCFTYSGYPVDHHDFIMKHRDNVKRCYPALEHRCPLVSSMVVVAAKLNSSMAI